MSPADSDAEAAPAQPEEAIEEAEEIDFLHDPDAADLTLGKPGKPFDQGAPYLWGLLAGAGALTAWWFGNMLIGLSSVFTLIVVALFLAVGLNPLVEFFMRRGLKRAWSVLIVIVIVLLALTIFVLAIAPIVSRQVTDLGDQAPGWLDQLLHNHAIQNLDKQYDIITKFKDYIQNGDLIKRVSGGVLGFGLAILGFLANVFVVTVLTLYFLASLPSMKRGIYSLAPATRRDRFSLIGDRVLRNIGGYVSGAFIVATCAGFSSLVFLFIVGLGSYALALALVVALTDVIPMIGATIGAVIVSAVAFATDLHAGIACVIFYVLYQQFENYVVYPRVMSRSVDVPGSLTVIAAIAGASLLGVVGALLAIPVAASILLIVKEVWIPRQETR